MLRQYYTWQMLQCISAKKWVILCMTSAIIKASIKKGLHTWHSNAHAISVDFFRPPTKGGDMVQCPPPVYTPALIERLICLQVYSTGIFLFATSQYIIHSQDTLLWCSYKYRSGDRQAQSTLYLQIYRTYHN